MAEYQISKGRYFYFAHLLSACAWNLSELAKLRNNEAVEDVMVHICQSELEATDAGGTGLAKKPTRI